MKCQHDVLARNAGLYKLLGHWARCAVVLDPNLAVVDIDVNDGTVYPADAVPADVHDFVVVTVAVHDGLRLDLAMRRLVTGLLLNETGHDLAVAV
jgi:hypothetical protein